jgi:hypothetical protein
MLDWEPRAVSNYSVLRKLPNDEAGARILEWLRSADPLQAAAGAHLVWDHIGGIFPELLSEVSATYWIWHRERADRDPRWLVRGSCVYILMSMKWPEPEIFHHAFAHAHTDVPVPVDPEFARFYSACGRPPAADPTGVVRFNALSALHSLRVPELVSLAHSVASAPEQCLHVLAATILAEADPANTISRILERAATATNDQVEQLSKSAVAALRSGGEGVRDSFLQLLFRCSGECLRVLAYDLASAKLPQSIPLLQATLEVKTDLSDRANLILDLVRLTDAETRFHLTRLLSTSCDGEANFLVDELVKWQDPQINVRLLELSKARGERLHTYAIQEIQRLEDNRNNWQ